MPTFQLPTDLIFNRGPVEDASAYAEERGVASWLFLVGDEFAAECKDWVRDSLEALRP